MKQDQSTPGSLPRHSSSGSKLTICKFQLLCLKLGWPWASYLSSLGLTFLDCEREMTTWEIMHTKPLACSKYPLSYYQLLYLPSKRWVKKCVENQWLGSICELYLGKILLQGKNSPCVDISIFTLGNILWKTCSLWTPEISSWPLSRSYW